MIGRLKRSRRLALGTVAALLGFAALSLTAKAFNPQPDPPGLGMVGIADGQTARLNLVNLGNPDPFAFAPPCRAQLQFFDAVGNSLAVSRIQQLKPGEATFLDYAASFVSTNLAVDAVGPSRAEIRPAVNTETGLLAPPCRVTVEIFDNETGRTSVLYAPPCRGGRCWVPPQ